MGGEVWLIYIAGAVFDARLFSVETYEAIVSDALRSGTFCEGWNDKFQSLVGHHHASVENNHVVPEGTFNSANCTQQDAVGKPAKKRVNKSLQKHLQAPYEDQVSGQKTIPEYLQGVGHNICVNKRQSVFTLLYFPLLFSLYFLSVYLLL